MVWREGVFASPVLRNATLRLFCHFLRHFCWVYQRFATFPVSFDECISVLQHFLRHLKSVSAFCNISFVIWRVYQRDPGPDLHSEGVFQRASMKATGGDMVGAVVYIYREEWLSESHRPCLPWLPEGGILLKKPILLPGFWSISYEKHILLPGFWSISYEKPILLPGFWSISYEKPILLPGFWSISYEKPILLLGFWSISYETPILLPGFWFISYEKPILLLGFSIIFVECISVLQHFLCHFKSVSAFCNISFVISRVYQRFATFPSSFEECISVLQHFLCHLISVLAFCIISVVIWRVYQRFASFTIHFNCF